MRKLLILLLVSTFTVSLSAKSVREMWLSMRDSIIPYLNHNQRIELLDFFNLNVKSEVRNLLGDSTVLDTLSTDYLHLTASPSMVIELKMLPCTHADSILCMIKTLSSPELESTIEFYDKDWNRLPPETIFDGASLDSIRSGLALSLSAISDEKGIRLINMPDPILMYTTLNPSTNEILFQLSIPLTNEEEKKEIKGNILPKKLKWSGKMFKSVIN